MMKKIVFCALLAVSTNLSGLSWGQGIVGGLLGGQGGASNNGSPPISQGGILPGAIRGQIQNAIQPNVPNGPTTSSNAQIQGASQSNGQIGVTNTQGGVQFGSNAQQIISGQQGGNTGTQLLGVLRTNLPLHATVGQDGTVRFRNDVNPQLRGMGILPNDQLIDSAGQPIRDLNAANSFLQANQNLRVMRNGQIVSIQQTNSNSNQVGWSLGTRNNGVFISSLASNSIAARAGLRAGDQIVRVNGNVVSRPEDISPYIMQADNSATTVSYIRNGQSIEATWNSPNQDQGMRAAPQSIQAKLEQIERLVSEIRQELSLAR